MNSKKSFITIIFTTFLIGCVLASCTPVDKPNAQSHTDNSRTFVLPSPQVRPSFVLDVSPQESQELPLSLFEADLTEEYLAQTGIFVEPMWGNDNTGYKDQICIEVDLVHLGQDGDDFSESSTLAARGQFLVDNAVLSDLLAGHSVLTLINVIDDQGNTTIRGVGPAIFCGTVELSAGIHEVIFQFHQTSGDVKSYKWYFALTEDKTTN